MKKIVGKFVRCARSDRVFPFVASSDASRGFVPLFSLKHAKALAVDFNGRYDEESSSFVLLIDGVEEAVKAQILMHKGRLTKFFEIGAGWGWEIVENSKIYEAFWGNGFFAQGKSFVKEDFFSEGRSYDADFIGSILSMDVGGFWQSPDCGSSHTFVRIY